MQGHCIKQGVDWSSTLLVKACVGHFVKRSGLKFCSSGQGLSRHHTINWAGVFVKANALHHVKDEVY